MKTLLLVSALLFPCVALADGDPAVTAPAPSLDTLQIGGETLSIHGFAGVATDYTFRGISLESGNPAFMAGAELSVPSGIYAGAFAVNLNPELGIPGTDAANAQVDVYAGYRQFVWGGSADVGVIQHLYAGQPSGADLAFTELAAGYSHPLGAATVTSAVYWTPDYAGPLDGAVYWTGDVSVPTPLTALTVSAGAGRQWFFDGFDSAGYTTWNVGATYAITKNISLDGRYIDTSEHSFGKPFGDRAVATVRYGF
jgi:uncharacterized protein (TIGR02001 family)